MKKDEIIQLLTPTQINSILDNTGTSSIATLKMNEIISDNAIYSIKDSIDSYDSYVSLIDLTKLGTQFRRIAEVFDTHLHMPISKREVEKRFAVSEMFDKIMFPITFTSLQDAIDKLDNAPGDLQRQLRSFFKIFAKYGLHKEEKKKKEKKKKAKKTKDDSDSDSDSDNIMYTFNPISKSECEAIVHPALRNIFKNKVDRIGFIQSKGGKCQLCTSTERLAIDHWRAHSVYNIDDPKLAVLLCEKCNNTHHNFDASHCIKKNKDLLSYLRNWIKIEKEIRGYGFQPNEVDLNTQRESMVYVNNHYCQNGLPLPDSFWEGLL
jgi:hypothetical protein